MIKTIYECDVCRYHVEEKDLRSIPSNGLFGLDICTNCLPKLTRKFQKAYQELCKEIEDEGIF